MTLKAWETGDQDLQPMQSWEFKPEDPQLALDPAPAPNRKYVISKVATGENIINNTLYRQFIVISLLSYESGVQMYTNCLVRETSSWDIKLTRC